MLRAAYVRILRLLENHSAGSTVTSHAPPVDFRTLLRTSENSYWIPIEHVWESWHINIWCHVRRQQNDRVPKHQNLAGNTKALERLNFEIPAA